MAVAISRKEELQQELERVLDERRALDVQIVPLGAALVADPSDLSTRGKWAYLCEARDPLVKRVWQLEREIAEAH